MKPWIVVLVSLGVSAGAQGATFNVTNTNDSGAGSLRWAIEQANSTPGPDTINTAAINTSTIALTSALPPITESVAVTGGVLTIDGRNAGAADGLVIAADDVYADYLTMTNFSGDGIVIKANHAVLSWMTSSGNRNGIRIEGLRARIEGATILSNAANGIWIMASSAASQIGSPAYECHALCGPVPDFDEISGNGGAGVRIDGDFNTVDSDFVGVRIDGQALPNGGDGIIVSGAHNVVVNCAVSNNGGSGINLLAPAHVQNNHGACNAGGFIAGSLIEPPRVMFARADPTAGTVGGFLQGEPNADYRIEVDAASATCPDTGTPQLGAITVTTNASGYAQWTGTFDLYGQVGSTFKYRTLTGVTVVATRGDTEVSRQSHPVTAFVTGETYADLRVQTTAPAGAIFNQVVDFVTIATNAGPAAVDGFMVKIPYTPGTVVVSTTTTSGYCDQLLTKVCYVGALGVGEVATIHERVRVSAASGTLHHIATALHYSKGVEKIDPNPSNDSATVDVGVAGENRRRAAGH
jgi:hypothetical protein